jgi:hypothetical protein
MTAIASAAPRVRTLLRDQEALVTLAWLVAAPLAAVAALAGWTWVVLAALALGYLADARVHATGLVASRWLARREMGAVDRALLRQSVALLCWVRVTEAPSWAVVLVASTIVVIEGAHAAYRVANRRHQRRRRGRIAWQGLVVDGRSEGPEVLPPTLWSPGNLTGPRVVLLIDVFLVAGLLVASLTRSWAPAVAGAALSLGAVLWSAWRVLERTLLIGRLPTPAHENARLRAALEAHAPAVAVYFSGGPDTTYQLNVWLETIDRLHQPALIILRERRHLDDLLPTSTPVVVLPRAQDVEEFQPASVRTVLYPTTVIKNNHMIRLRGVRHVFINHGDGDKAVTFSPLHRVFDEIWVAGQAACDRYLTKGEGVRPEQLVTVGRPQLAHIVPVTDRPGTDRRTVLYAPTWEGNFDGVNYSSVAPMGELVVDTLLELGVRVLFKAHPATGTRLPQAARARAAIERRLREAGDGHEVVGTAPDSLYRAFNEADVLVADISSVVADFLASRKPYLVTNPGRRSVEDFDTEFPSTQGGAVVAPDAAAVHAAVADALGEDLLRPRREELATYFLGEPVADPVERFAAEIDAAVLRSPAVRTTEADEADVADEQDEDVDA